MKNVDEAVATTTDTIELDIPNENKDLLDSHAQEEIIRNHTIMKDNEAKAITRLEEKVKTLAKERKEKKHPMVGYFLTKNPNQTILLQ